MNEKEERMVRYRERNALLPALSYNGERTQNAHSATVVAAAAAVRHTQREQRQSTVSALRLLSRILPEERRKDGEAGASHSPPCFQRFGHTWRTPAAGGR